MPANFGLPAQNQTGVKRNYHIVVGRSSKEVVGPYPDRAGFPMMAGGGAVAAIGDGRRWAAVSNGYPEILVSGWH